MKFISLHITRCRKLIIMTVVLLVGALSTMASVRQMADSLFTTACAKSNNSEPADAMEDFFAILKLAEGEDAGIPDELLSKSHLMLGNIYLAYGDNINAAKHYEAGMQLSDDPDQQLKFAYNLSLAYCMLGQEDKSRTYHRRINELRVSDTALWQYDKVLSEAFIEKSFGDRHRSVTLYKRAVQLVDSLKMSPGHYAVAPLSEIVEHYDRENDTDSSLYWLRRYEAVAGICHSPHIIADCHRAFMQHYIKTGEREKALEYSRRYLLDMDSLVNYNSFIRVSSKREREREAAADAQIRSLEFTVSKQKFFIFTIIAIVAFVAVSLLLAKRMRRYTRQLFARNRELAILEEAITHSTGAQAEEPPAGDTAPEARPGQWEALMERVRAAVSKPENFCAPDFSINTLAALCNSNTRYISQAINETTGDNFRTLVNGYRIREARRRLTSDPGFADLTIQSVGESVGFRSASNFINAFKKVTGMTPSLYQRMAREKGE